MARDMEKSKWAIHTHKRQIGFNWTVNEKLLRTDS